jgi:hypothetical protein
LSLWLCCQVSGAFYSLEIVIVRNNYDRGGIGGVHHVYELKTADIWRQTNNGIFLYKHQNGGRISTSFI